MHSTCIIFDSIAPLPPNRCDIYSANSTFLMIEIRRHHYSHYSEVDGFNVTYTDEEGNMKSEIIPGPGPHDYNVTGLTPGTRYTFNTSAFNAGGSSSPCTSQGQTGNVIIQQWFHL